MNQMAAAFGVPGLFSPGKPLFGRSSQRPAQSPGEQPGTLQKVYVAALHEVSRETPRLTASL